MTPTEEIRKLKLTLRRVRIENKLLHGKVKSADKYSMDMAKRIDALSDSYTKAEGERVQLLNAVDRLSRGK